MNWIFDTCRRTIGTACLALCVMAMVTDAHTQNDDYQTKAISPAHRAKINSDLQNARAKVSQARNPQDWGVAMEELCKQLLQTEDYDNAIKAANAVARQNGVDRERRAAHHFLVAQILALKMEASPNTGEMQRNKRLALSAAQEVREQNYPAQWGITDQAQKLIIKLSDGEYTQSVAQDISKRQTGGVTAEQLNEARRQSQSLEFNSQTGKLKTGTNLWSRLRDSEDSYGDAPSLSGNNSQTKDYTNATPQDFSDRQTRLPDEKFNQQSGTNDRRDLQEQFRATTNMTPGNNALNYVPRNATKQGNLRQSLGGYSPYPSIPSLNAEYESKSSIESPTEKLIGRKLTQSVPKKVDGAPSNVSNLQNTTTEELISRAANRTSAMPRYGTVKGEKATRAYSYETDEGAKARSKRPDVYKKRNDPATDVYVPDTMPASRHGGLIIDGETIQGQTLVE
ncbi:MAG: hypothetical protein PHX74_02245 [Candidatus Sumerlaeales bacterium]|nr:hypothetical protein [Candidatus Sumerlaeales bacterium]